jgi:hypothetical protein
VCFQINITTCTCCFETCANIQLGIHGSLICVLASSRTLQRCCCCQAL